MQTLLGLVVVFLCATGLGFAQGNALKLTPLPNATQFSFGWLYHNQPQTLTFAIPNADLQRGQNEFQRFDNAKAQAFALKAATQKAKSLSTNGFTVTVQPQAHAYKIGIESFSITAPSATLISATQAAVNAAYDDGLQRYLFNAFYLNYNQRYIMPDHKRIAVRYAQALRPMVQSIAQKTQGMSERARIDWLLGFFQSIPYDTLENRQTSNGSGFNTPYALLRFNRGDCDSKSVALLAVLRALHPTLPLAMVYVPEHAFVAIGVPQGKNDYALKLGQRTYVLADPTGPRIMRLGEVDAKALKALEGGRFSYQMVQGF